MPPPLGAGLPLSQELRKDARLPAGASGKIRRFWEAFFDNYDAAEVVTVGEALERAGKPTPWDTSVGKAFEGWNMLSESSKEVISEYKAQALGASIDGVAGIAQPYPDKLAELLGWTCICLPLRDRLPTGWRTLWGDGVSVFSSAVPP